jgi:SAM-dependent methyltransferase
MASWKIYQKLPWLQPITAFVAKLPREAQVLDLGSSVGARVQRLLEVRPDLRFTASDLEDFSQRYPPHVQFRQFNATARFPFDDATFDAVISTHLFEHLPPPKLEQVVGEIERILKPGGRVYIEAPGVRSLFYPSIRIGLDRAGEGSGPSNFLDDVTHVQPFTLGRLYKLFFYKRFDPIRVAIHRNKLFLLASPVLLLSGLVLRKRVQIVTALYHLGGWAVYLTATRSQGRSKL